jgi:hypothetical protein
MQERGTVFTWLDEVRARPAMWLGERPDPLRGLEDHVWGYYTALDMNGIVEDVPQMTTHFLVWLREETGWSTAPGWAIAVTMHARKDPVAKFFDLVDRYRRLVPVVERTATLTDHEVARVDVLRYRPTRLYFGRVWRGGRPSDTAIFMTGAGSHATNLGFAQRSLAKKLGLAPRSTAWLRPTVSPPSAARPSARRQSPGWRRRPKR